MTSYTHSKFNNMDKIVDCLTDENIVEKTFAFVKEIDATNMVALRNAAKSQGKQLTYTAIFVKAGVKTLAAFPFLNRRPLV